MGQVAGDILSLGAVAAAPFTAGTSLAWLPETLGGLATINGVVGQNSQQNAYNKAMQQNQQGALGQSQSLAKDLAQGPNLQSLINAEGSGVKTLESNIGGVANPGALIKELFGKNIESATGAALGNRSSDLQGAINALLSGSSQYGAAQRATSSPGAGIAGLASGAGSIFNALKGVGGGGQSAPAPTPTFMAAPPPSFGPPPPGPYTPPSGGFQDVSAPYAPPPTNWDPSVGGGTYG